MPKKTSKHSYENIIIQLEQIVDQMEKGDVSLEKNLQLFEEGVTLIKDCKERLDNAELKVKKLLRSSGEEFKLEDYK